MRFWAILKDSFYETIDFKVFYVLVGLSLFLGLACKSFTFPRLSPLEAVQKNLGAHAGPERSMGGDGSVKRGDAAVTVSDFHATDADGAGLSEASSRSGRFRFVMTPVEAKNFGLAILAAAKERELMQQFLRGEIRPNALGAIFRQMMPEKPPSTPAEWNKAVERQVNSIPGLAQAKVISMEMTDANPPTRIEVEADIDWRQMQYTHQLGILFGVWKVDIRRVDEIVFIFQTAMVDWIAGWAGLIVSLVVTAGFIPNMLQKGAVDLLLVKPIHRWFLLLAKYLGGLLFVLFNGAVLIGVTWIALASNTGNWSPWYLASIPVLLFYFAILYSLSVLMGVLTRSALVAILVTVGFWFVLFLVNQLYVFAHLPDNVRPEEFTFPPLLVSIVDWVHFLLPKPGTLSHLNQQLLLKANDSVELVRQTRSFMPTIEVSWGETIGTSAAFIALMLGLACWRFSRRDY